MIEKRGDFERILAILTPAQGRIVCEKMKSKLIKYLICKVSLSFCNKLIDLLGVAHPIKLIFFYFEDKTKSYNLARKVLQFVSALMDNDPLKIQMTLDLLFTPNPIRRSFRLSLFSPNRLVNQDILDQIVSLDLCWIKKINDALGLTLFNTDTNPSQYKIKEAMNHYILTTDHMDLHAGQKRTYEEGEEIRELLAEL